MRRRAARQRGPSCVRGGRGGGSCRAMPPRARRARGRGHGARAWRGPTRADGGWSPSARAPISRGRPGVDGRCLAPSAGAHAVGRGRRRRGGLARRQGLARSAGSRAVGGALRRGRRRMPSAAPDAIGGAVLPRRGMAVAHPASRRTGRSPAVRRSGPSCVGAIRSCGNRAYHRDGASRRPRSRCAGRGWVGSPGRPACRRYRAPGSRGEPRGAAGACGAHGARGLRKPREHRATLLRR